MAGCDKILVDKASGKLARRSELHKVLPALSYLSRALRGGVQKHVGECVCRPDRAVHYAKWSNKGSRMAAFSRVSTWHQFFFG